MVQARISHQQSAAITKYVESSRRHSQLPHRQTVKYAFAALAMIAGEKCGLIVRRGKSLDTQKDLKGFEPRGGYIGENDEDDYPAPLRRYSQLAQDVNVGGNLTSLPLLAF